jgi:flavin-dependent dehydrogenase
MIYDIAVIGLGPAGAAFARLVDSERYRVAAFDRKSPECPEKYAKPCGGLLAPDAQRALARFGLSIPGSVVASPQIFCVRTVDLDNGLTNNYQRFYLNIDRTRFDLWLMSLIPGSVDVYDGTQVTRIREEDGVYIVDYRRGATAGSVSARHIVGADGALSVVSHAFFRQDMRRFRLCIQESYPHHDQEPFFSCVFDSASSDSYAWSLSKDDRFIVGGAYAIRGGVAAFERQKCRLAPPGARLSDPVKREACLVCRPRSLRDIRLGRGRVLLLGEAAGFISPSSCEGISGALDSAYLLSRVFNAGASDVLRAYRRAAVRLRARYLWKIVKADVLCSRGLRRLIMKSRFRHIEVAAPPCGATDGYPPQKRGSSGVSAEAK